MTGAAVAIIVPAKNAECVLAAASDSLLRQTRRDWEAIIVNDGSADGTGDIAGGRPGVARLGDSAMNLPRIEIRGDWDIETFAQNVEATR